MYDKFVNKKTENNSNFKYQTDMFNVNVYNNSNKNYQTI